ncbi:hypothetical protein PYW07_004808 [Mythimna separata]|uniref:Odorant receptor n=1 Tax=Mythimna separata TaxID=271217 RepID=A0AAD7YWQ9_MYTSE|nr:hypothetical protein PYW07_004808 [Mythimna separata]
MGLVVKNATLSVTVSLTILQTVGFWAPQHWTDSQKQLYSFYSLFSFMFLLGTYLIIQVVDLGLIWGDLALMTGTAFLLFTNLAQAAKIVNIVGRKQRIQDIVNNADRVLSEVTTKEEKDIVESCNREMTVLQTLYFFLTLVTSVGWATSAETGQLPLRAWYPYDTTKSPAYEITYVHQVGALLIAANLNVAKDTLVAGLIGQCRCRLKLLGHALRTLGKGMDIEDEVTSEHAHRSHDTLVAGLIGHCRCRLKLLGHALRTLGKGMDIDEVTSEHAHRSHDTLVAGLIGHCRCRLKLLGHALRTLGKGMDIEDEGTSEHAHRSHDTLVAGLIGQCRCRLKLLGHALRTLGKGMDIEDEVTSEHAHRSHDTLVAGLIGQCRCRLKLLGHALRTLGKGMDIEDEVTPEHAHRSHDTLVAGLIGQCRSRLQLLGHALRTLGKGMDIEDEVTSEHAQPECSHDTLVAGLIGQCRCRLKLLGMPCGPWGKGMDIEDEVTSEHAHRSQPECSQGYAGGRPDRAVPVPPEAAGACLADPGQGDGHRR